jgi:hypothetical protein
VLTKPHTSNKKEQTDGNVPVLALSRSSATGPIGVHRLAVDGLLLNYCFLLGGVVVGMSISRGRQAHWGRIVDLHNAVISACISTYVTRISMVSQE